mgnify:CR=1 FL=1
MSFSYGNNNAGASVNGNFIPVLWSSKLLKRFYMTTILSSIVNQDYAGEISSHGAKVVIRRPPVVSINQYVPSGIAGHTPLEYQELTTEELELIIDQAFSFSFKVDDVLKAQADVGIMNAAMGDAGENMKIAVETQVLGNIFSGAATQVGSSASPVSVSKDDVIDMIVEAGTRLDEKNIGESGRFLAIPPWMGAKIKTSDLKDASLSGDAKSPLRNGLIGNVDRFSIYVSNNLPVTDATGKLKGSEGFDPATASTKVLAGTKAFASYANQVTKTENVKLEKQFGEAIRGLHVHGSKVVQPDAGVCIHAKAA